jgi:hypothetical protein
MAIVDLFLEAGTIPDFRLKRTTGTDNTIFVVSGSCWKQDEFWSKIFVTGENGGVALLVLG